MAASKKNTIMIADDLFSFFQLSKNTIKGNNKPIMTCCGTRGIVCIDKL